MPKAKSSQRSARARTAAPQPPNGQAPTWAIGFALMILTYFVGLGLVKLSERIQWVEHRNGRRVTTADFTDVAAPPALEAAAPGPPAELVPTGYRVNLPPGTPEAPKRPIEAR